MSITIKGLDDLKRRLKRMAESLDKVRDFAFIEVNKTRNEMIYEMRNTPKTGRTYTRGKKIHIASSPYNAPAIDSGNYIRSLVIERNTTTVELGTLIQDPEYPLFLEKGTVHMDQRPVFEPAYNNLVNRVNVGIKRLKL
jgi:hypothetical protein